MAENSNPLLLIGSPIDSGEGDKEQTRAVLHLAFILCILRNTSARVTVLSSHTFGNSGRFHEQVPRYVPDSD